MEGFGVACTVGTSVLGHEYVITGITFASTDASLNCRAHQVERYWMVFLSQMWHSRRCTLDPSSPPRCSTRVTRVDSFLNVLRAALNKLVSSTSCVCLGELLVVDAIAGVERHPC